ncbi:MAG TPA: hypothetical protein VMZ53_32970 [Kofleriaceae bacterium]|nr:hypothetical protein [Kofleriaceae bacterium]
MTALRVPTLGALGLVTVLTGGLAATKLVRHCPHAAGSPELVEPPAADEPTIETQARLHDPVELSGCEAPHIRNVVLRGQFIAHRTEVVDHFAIQLPGRTGSYSAITDSRGYFEMRIPREDFEGDLCNLDWWHSFSDESMTLQYIVDFE